MVANVRIIFDLYGNELDKNNFLRGWMDVWSVREQW